jgi:hypothetical protein
MTSKELDALAKLGKLKAEPPTQEELDGLVRSGLRRLKDAENKTLSLESRFDLAYNAAHALALAALRFHGYRSEHRYLVFQCLGHTLQMKPAEWRILDQAHSKRNAAEYLGDAEIDKSLVEATIRAARDLEKRIKALGPIPS